MKKNIAVILVSLAGVAGASAELVSNPSYEQGVNPDTNGGYINVKPGENTIEGWQVDFGDVDYISSMLWQAHDGGRSIDLNGQNRTSPGSISQIVPLIIGQEYQISFFMSGNPHGGDPLRTLQVTLGDDVTADFSYDILAEGTTTSDMKWKFYTIDFVATTDSARLQFASTMGKAWGPVVDDIAVDPVPAPGAMGLLAVGALFAAARRRR